MRPNYKMSLPVKVEPGVLSEISLNDLNAIADELSHAYKYRQIFRTETEARISVLDELRHPTNASKYWQAVREQTTMLEQLSLLSFEYRRNEVEIKRQKRNLSTAMDDLDKEDIQINLDECMFKKSNMETVANDRVREILMWSKLKKEVTDGFFDTSDVNEHQLVSYTAKFALSMSLISPTQQAGDEYLNLSGQLNSALKRCRDVGVIDRVYNLLPGDVVNSLEFEEFSNMQLSSNN